MFWKGHVAIVRDRETLIHANAFHMAVAIEPIAEAVARIREAGSEITSVRRIAPARKGRRRIVATHPQCDLISRPRVAQAVHQPCA